MTAPTVVLFTRVEQHRRNAGAGAFGLDMQANSIDSAKDG